MNVQLAAAEASDFATTLASPEYASDERDYKIAVHEVLSRLLAPNTRDSPEFLDRLSAFCERQLDLSQLNLEPDQVAQIEAAVAASHGVTNAFINLAGGRFGVNNFIWIPRAIRSGLGEEIRGAFKTLLDDAQPLAARVDGFRDQLYAVEQHVQAAGEFESNWSLVNISLAFVAALLGAYDPERYTFYAAGPLRQSYEELVGSWPRGSAGERYEAICEFVQSVREELVRLGAPVQDMIDAQSFIWLRRAGANGDRPMDLVVTSADAVRAAMAEFDRRGREQFLEQYGYGKAQKFFIREGTSRYDSKAVYGVAYGYEHPDDGPLSNHAFSGGEATVKRRLEALGFEVVDDGDVLAEAERRAWIVRAGQNGQNEGLALSNDLVVIGWQELGDLSPVVSGDDLRSLYERTYPEQTPPSVAQQVGIILRFLRDIQVGDLVVLPLKTRRGHVAVGRVEGAYEFQPEAPDDAHNTRRVTWLDKALPYEAFDPDLRRTFGLQGTVREFLQANAYDRILSVASRTTPRYWWVNQGSSYQRARAGAFLWAPNLDKAGRTKSHWLTMHQLRPGDFVFSYANAEIRALNEVIAAAVPATRPDPEADQGWNEEGNRAELQWQDIDPPILLRDIPVEWRTREGGPFAGDGSVNQGYLFPLSDEFVARMGERFPQLSLDVPPPPTPPIADEDYVEPPLPDIAAALAGAGMTIDERTLRRFHLSLKTRGFVVLSGISGTGKTWLAEEYANAVGARPLVVPVAPNWTTNEDLLGYLNPLTQQYHDTEFSSFLRDAATESASASTAGRQPRPYHLVLDEMNLARVEYYFAKFLSAMELRARSEDAFIELSPNDRVLLPPNLKFIGTVNVDETTHGFADKVYDRSQLLELSIDEDAVELHLGDSEFAPIVVEVWRAMREVAPFAFRVLDEITAYIAEAAREGVAWEEALDEQLLQKVLPKVRGTDLRVGGALREFVELSADRFPLSYEKATVMLRAFNEHGYTSYF